jgi:hypothetical protein
MALHDNAVLLTVEEAAILGHMIADRWSQETITGKRGDSGQTHCRFSL